MPSDNRTPTPDRLFHCTRCGECCRGFGGTYVSDADMGAIAELVGCPPEDFARRYCRTSGGRPLLAQRDDGYCIFYDGGCTIHPVKPRMCRRWPFIESVRTDPLNWSIMAGSCPGMRTDVALERVRECVRRVLEGEDKGEGRP
ncbi:MAG: YkgJ family cysteine cluster protein [Desulfobacterales bacterium]|nr:YkgJ family cysteine cluster protein [Desulfobacterales bacterium]